VRTGMRSLRSLTA